MARAVCVVLALTWLACGGEGSEGRRSAPFLPADSASMTAQAPIGTAATVPAGVPPVMAAPTDPGAQDPDDDGLSTAYELANRTDPMRADSDGDAVSDLAEQVAGTDPTDAGRNPRSQGDFYFLSPWNTPPTPARETLVFATQIRSADLLMLVDTTRSMNLVIALLQAQLSNAIVPQLSALIPDLQIGVGSFEDVPVAPYGNAGDEVMSVQQVLTADTQAAQSGVNALMLGSGGDIPEAAIPALYALVTGRGIQGFLPAAASCPDGGLGNACFRPDAVPIVLLVSDAQFHNGPDDESAYIDIDPPLPTYADAVDALRAIHARVISVGVGPGLDIDLSLVGVASAVGSMPEPTATAREQMERLSADTGAVDASGKPFFFAVDQDASGLEQRVVDAVQAVAEHVPIAVTAVIRDDPSDAEDATLLIERVEPNTQGGVADPLDPTRVCHGGQQAQDRDADGRPDTFVGVLPGVPLCFDVVPRTNTSVQSGDKPAVYKAYIDVIGDGTTTLSTHEVFFLVPPSSPLLR